MFIKVPNSSFMAILPPEPLWATVGFLGSVVGWFERRPSLLENLHAPPKEDWVVCRVFHKRKGEPIRIGNGSIVEQENIFSYGSELEISIDAQMEQLANAPDGCHRDMGSSIPLVPYQEGNSSNTYLNFAVLQYNVFDFPQEMMMGHSEVIGMESSHASGDEFGFLLDMGLDDFVHENGEGGGAKLTSNVEAGLRCHDGKDEVRNGLNNGKKLSMRTLKDGGCRKNLMEPWDMSGKGGDAKSLASYAPVVTIRRHQKAKTIEEMRRNFRRPFPSVFPAVITPEHCHRKDVSLSNISAGYPPEHPPEIFPAEKMRRMFFSDVRFTVGSNSAGNPLETDNFRRIFYFTGGFCPPVVVALRGVAAAHTIR
ncbi:hypothetical protein IEQ34_018301 [Dendrobium chrysotoxum]|uniref:Uncharacterized protein n=1 Tax=Dendrobium chrysotoxum TaxID=161865 RepID=A0AAV7GEG6_DENCH|nr:hypothetical protein IEQ34_018301 [Dendrobium chrysotoxum]